MGLVDKVVKNLRHPKKPFNLPLAQIFGPHDELLFHGLFSIFSSFKAYCTPAKAQTSESLHAYAWGCKYPVLQKMIWSLLGVCRNLKQWSTVVKSPVPASAASGSSIVEFPKKLISICLLPHLDISIEKKTQHKRNSVQLEIYISSKMF